MFYIWLKAVFEREVFDDPFDLALIILMEFLDLRDPAGPDNFLKDALAFKFPFNIEIFIFVEFMERWPPMQMFFPA